MSLEFKHVGSETCSECHFYGSGICRRYPPHMIPERNNDGYGGFTWISTTAYTNVWEGDPCCGEFTPKDSTP